MSAEATTAPPADTPQVSADLDTILADPSHFTVPDETGQPIPVVLRRLKSREFFALLRVFTGQFGGFLQRQQWAGTPEEVGAQVVGMLIAMLPEVDGEFLAFIRLVLDPADQADATRLTAALDNPEVEVLIDLAEHLAVAEKDDVVSLTGKATAAFRRMQSLYQTKKTPPPAAGPSSPSPAPST